MQVCYLYDPCLCKAGAWFYFRTQFDHATPGCFTNKFQQITIPVSLRCYDEPIV